VSEVLVRTGFPDLLTKTKAVFSPCENYRYSLTWRWSPGPSFTVVLLNPSTATEMKLDATLKRVKAFAEREEMGAFTVLNLFAFRATDPEDMKRAPDPIGPSNNHCIQAEIDKSPGFIVVGWGVHGDFLDRDGEVCDVLRSSRKKIMCFGRTKDGQPRHPLYLPKKAELLEYKL